MPTVSLDPKPFYAYLGAGDVAIARLRARVGEVPSTLKSVSLKSVSLKDVPATLQQQAKTAQEQAKALPVRLQTLPVSAKELPAQFAQQRAELAARAEKLYTDFAARGEQVVAELKSSKLLGRVTDLRGNKPAATPAAKPAAKPASPAKASAKPAAAKASQGAVPTQPTTTGQAS